MNLQTGAFGDPADMNTLILFWQKMDELHYPGAGETKQYLEARLQEQMIQQEEMMAQQREAALHQMKNEKDIRMAEIEADSTEKIMKGMSANGNQKTKEKNGNE